MQVSQQDTHITHAVLGGQGNISFGISDDPAFFQILSSALYKDPMLAMIRETICNAWDAHIDSERTDMPLTIKLEHDKLVIRDYGKGIPHHLIGPIYGVYGASTKKNDGRQTGGFGLGCKSPFAYTEHFEVISHHDNKKTIYNMSKSSAEKMGKPSIVTIATFPTTETGIQITIPLKGDGSDCRIKELIQRVVFNGDILALLNGEALPQLGLGKAPHGFLLINKNHSMSGLPLRTFSGYNLFVRYGNVIYPIECTSEIETLYNKVSNMLQKLYNCYVVFMAPPDSISITPSRESLTMSELTVETLKSLLSNFLAHMMNNRQITQRHIEMVSQYIDDAATSDKNATADKLMHSSWYAPGVPTTHDKTILSNLDDFAMLEVICRNTKQQTAFTGKRWMKIINQFLNKMLETGQIQQGLLQTWQNTARKCQKHMQDPSNRRYNHWGYSKRDNKELHGATSWWYKNVGMPMIKKLQKATPLFKTTMLSYVDPRKDSNPTKRGITIPSDIDKVTFGHHTYNLRHLIKPTLVVCHNAELITKRMNDFKRVSDSDGSYQFRAYFVLEIPRKNEMIVHFMEAVSGLGGMEVIDMTGRTASEEDAYQDRMDTIKAKREAERLFKEDLGEKPPEKKKRNEGFVTMMSMLCGTKMDKFDGSRLTADDVVHIKEPQFIEKISTASEKCFDTDHLNSALAVNVAKLWGHLGAVTNHSGVYNRQLEKGVRGVSTFLADRVTNEIANNPEIHAYMEFNPEKAESFVMRLTGNYRLGQDVLQFYKLLLTTPVLHSLVPNYVPLTEENQLRVAVWKGIKETYSLASMPAVTDAQKVLDVIELSDETQELLKELLASPFLGLLDLDALKKATIHNRKDPVVMAKILSVVNLIIN